MTRHGVIDAIDRGVKPFAILDALKNPLQIGAVKYDKLGRPSVRYIGRWAEVVINPETGKVVSIINPTSTKKALKLLSQ